MRSIQSSMPFFCDDENETLMQKKQTRKLETERDGKPQTKYIKVINEQRR